MKKAVLIGVLSAFSVLGLVGILAPAKAANDGMPVGTILAWGGPSSSVPAGWMVCNGKALSKTGYAALFAAIGKSWGSAGDKFNLPDLRGRFLRGEDGGTGLDPDAKKRAPSSPGGSATGVGSVQEDSLQNHAHAQNPHRHNYTTSMAGFTAQSSASSPYIAISFNSLQGYATDSVSTDTLGSKQYKTKSSVKSGEESRPKNAAVIFIIKVK